MVDAIKGLPPIIPQPRLARWVKKEYWRPLAFDTFPALHDGYAEKTHSVKAYRYYCLHCNYSPEYKLTRFCPECGAKMKDKQKVRIKSADIN